jgi:hypothetical protein
MVFTIKNGDYRNFISGKRREEPLFLAAFHGHDAVPVQVAQIARIQLDPVRPGR